ncbi:hypothetical protein T484DRAFT_1764139, partial [Baffinella frigidus]
AAKPPAPAAPAPAWGGAATPLKPLKGSNEISGEDRARLRRALQAAAAAAEGTPVGRQARGIVNPGNMCFASAVVQGLLGSARFFRLLDGLKGVALPDDAPTLSALVELCGEFVHLESADAPPRGDEASEAKSGEAKPGAWGGAGTAPPLAKPQQVSLEPRTFRAEHLWG